MFARPARERFSARDSAGIRVVEHVTLDGLPVRRPAAAAPTVSIGSVAVEDSQLLAGGSAEVRFYDQGGARSWCGMWRTSALRCSTRPGRSRAPRR